MHELIKRNFTLTLNFKKRKKVIKFDEPFIWDLLIFQDLVKKQKYISAMKLIVKDLNEKDFLSNPDGIINAIGTLIYGKTKKSEKEINEYNGDSDGFLPSTIDLMSNRYGVLPVDLMKKTTFSQLITFVKGYEWNMNIQNGEEQKNIRILMNSENDDENKNVNEKDLKNLKKSMKIFKKMGGMPKID